MPMGIVSDSDFQSEHDKLNQKRPIKNPSVKIPEVVEPEKGRGKNSVEVPDSLRKLIGDESATSGREAALELAKNFGLSPSSVSAYSVGATSTASYEKRPNAPAIKQAKEKIQFKARRKLMLALNHITDEKLSESKARDLAGIAKDMSAVVRNMEPEQKNPNGEATNAPSFIVYSPVFKQENHFDSIRVKE